jgi:hypothetical protein
MLFGLVFNIAFAVAAEVGTSQVHGLNVRNLG